MISIADVVSWKFGKLEGMRTNANIIITFPPGVAGVNYDENGIPSQIDQDIWVSEYENHINKTAYIEKRKQSYASFEDQLDMLYWDQVNNTTTFKSHRDTVKSMYPKPS